MMSAHMCPCHPLALPTQCGRSASADQERPLAPHPGHHCRAFVARRRPGHQSACRRGPRPPGVVEGVRLRFLEHLGGRRQRNIVRALALLLI